MSKKSVSVCVSIPSVPRSDSDTLPVETVVQIEEPLDILVKKPKTIVLDIEKRLEEAKSKHQLLTAEKMRISQLPIKPTRDGNNFDVIEKVAYYIRDRLIQMKVVYDLVDKIMQQLGLAFTMSGEKIESFKDSFYFKVPIREVLAELNQLTSNVDEDSISQIIYAHERMNNINVKSDPASYSTVYDLFRSITPIKDENETQLDDSDHSEKDCESDVVEIIDPIQSQLKTNYSRDATSLQLKNFCALHFLEKFGWNQFDISVLCDTLFENFEMKWIENIDSAPIGATLGNPNTLSKENIMEIVNRDMATIGNTSPVDSLELSERIETREHTDKQKKKKKKMTMQKSESHQKQSPESSPSVSPRKFESIRIHHVDYANLPHLSKLAYLGIRHGLIETIQLNYHDVITIMHYDEKTEPDDDRWITLSELLSHAEVRCRFADLIAARLKKRQCEREYSQLKYFTEAETQEYCLLHFCFPFVHVSDSIPDKKDNSQKTPMKKILHYDDTVYRDASEKYRYTKELKRKEK